MTGWCDGAELLLPPWMLVFPITACPRVFYFINQRQEEFVIHLLSLFLYFFFIPLFVKPNKLDFIHN